MLNLQELSDKGELFDGRYLLLRPLSTDGATADVWLAIDTNTIDKEIGEEPEERNDETGMKVAIKVYRPKNALDIEGEQRFRLEYKIAYECRHANLLQPTGFSIYGEYPYLVLPFCQYGSSEQLIGKELPEDEIWKYILDVSSGLNRLHTNDPQIVHQDIKPANILIDNTHNYTITDFGISLKRNEFHGYSDEDNSGTMAYMAPERFQEETEPMPQSDIWGFGATLFEILTKKVPFGEEGGKNQPQSKDSMPPMPGVPTSIQHLVYACLDFDPGNRPTAQNLMEAARFKQFPIKRKRGLWIAVTVVVLFVSGFFVWDSFVSSPNTPMTEPLPAVPVEESFEKALTMMRNPDSSTFMTGYYIIQSWFGSALCPDTNTFTTSIFMMGYHLMDSLSQMQYIPAMHEMAFTHGWYSDSESLRRKDMLGIKYKHKSSNTPYMPIDDNENQKAIHLLLRILEIGDTNYASLNGEAAYRMAGYYINGTLLDTNKQKAWNYLNEAQDWAMLSKDTVLLSKIEIAKENLNRI